MKKHTFKIIVGLYLIFISTKALAFNEIKDSTTIDTKPKIKQSVELNYTNQSFTKYYKSWQSEFFQYIYKKNKTTLIPRINIANRYTLNGLQIEADWYQLYAHKWTTYVNYANSNSILYPQHRWGVEAYKAISAKSELSLGIRQLYFASTKNLATFYTFSASTYLRNNWISYRNFIVPRNNSVANTHLLSVRHYLKKDDEYLGIMLGIGFAQNQPLYLNGQYYGADPAFFLRNKRFGFSAVKNVYKNILLKPSIEISRQEISPHPSEFQPIYLISIGLAKKI